MENRNGFCTEKVMKIENLVHTNAIRILNLIKVSEREDLDYVSMFSQYGTINDFENIFDIIEVNDNLLYHILDKVLISVTKRLERISELSDDDIDNALETYFNLVIHIKSDLEQLIIAKLKNEFEKLNTNLSYIGDKIEVGKAIALDNIQKSDRDDLDFNEWELKFKVKNSHKDLAEKLKENYMLIDYKRVNKYVDMMYSDVCDIVQGKVISDMLGTSCNVLAEYKYNIYYGITRISKLL